MSRELTFSPTIQNVSQVPSGHGSGGGARSQAVLYVDKPQNPAFANDLQLTIDTSDGSAFTLRRNHWFTVDFSNFLSGPNDLQGATMDEVTGWAWQVQGNAFTINYVGAEQSVKSVTFNLHGIKVTVDKAHAVGKNVTVNPTKFDIKTAEPVPIAVQAVPQAANVEPVLVPSWQPSGRNAVISNVDKPGVNEPLYLLIENRGSALPASGATVTIYFDAGAGPGALATEAQLADMTIVPVTGEGYDETWQSDASSSANHYVFRSTGASLLEASGGQASNQVKLALNSIKTTAGSGTPHVYITVSFPHDAGFNEATYTLPIQKVDDKVYIADNVMALTADGKDALQPGVTVAWGQPLTLQWHTRGASYSEVQGAGGAKYSNDGLLPNQVNTATITPSPSTHEYTIVAYRETESGSTVSVQHQLAIVFSTSLIQSFSQTVKSSNVDISDPSVTLTLSWSTTDAQYVRVTSSNSDENAKLPTLDPAARSLDVTPTIVGPTTYTLHAFPDVASYQNNQAADTRKLVFNPPPLSGAAPFAVGFTDDDPPNAPFTGDVPETFQMEAQWQHYNAEQLSMTVTPQVGSPITLAAPRQDGAVVSRSGIRFKATAADGTIETRVSSTNVTAGLPQSTSYSDSYSLPFPIVESFSLMEINANSIKLNFNASWAFKIQIVIAMYQPDRGAVVLDDGRWDGSPRVARSFRYDYDAAKAGGTGWQAYTELNAPTDGSTKRLDDSDTHGGVGYYGFPHSVGGTVTLTVGKELPTIRTRNRSDSRWASLAGTNVFPAQSAWPNINAQVVPAYLPSDGGDAMIAAYAQGLPYRNRGVPFWEWPGFGPGQGNMVPYGVIVNHAYQPAAWLQIFLVLHGATPVSRAGDVWTAWENADSAATSPAKYSSAAGGPLYDFAHPLLGTLYIPGSIIPGTNALPCGDRPANMYEQMFDDQNPAALQFRRFFRDDAQINAASDQLLAWLKRKFPRGLGFTSVVAEPNYKFQFDESVIQKMSDNELATAFFGKFTRSSSLVPMVPIVPQDLAAGRLPNYLLVGR